MTEISVVIPTRNRADLLPAALESILRQDLDQDQYEVIVVDNGSTDGTATAAQAFATRFKNFSYLYDERPGLHIGRHCGLKAAKSQVIVYADDDIEASSTWLSTIKDCFADQGTVLAGGNNIPLFLATPPAWLTDLWTRYSAFEGGKAMAALSILELPEGRREISPHYVWGLQFRNQKTVPAGRRWFPAGRHAQDTASLSR
jgi:glucosyl-dolichyl phosphate glucuronosyltransferase